MFFYQKTLIVLLVLFMAVALSGCGENAEIASSPTRLEASEACIECHQSVRSPVTGNLIVEEWKLSSHNLNNWAGCVDCHEPDAGHPSSCNLCHGGTPSVASASDVVHNPDESGKCAKCHTAKAGFGFSTLNGITINTLVYHFSTPTFGSYTTGLYGLQHKFSARYVTKNYEKNCRSCHNPHDTTSQMDILRQWSRSGKGDVNAKPWSWYIFRYADRGTATPGATPANSFGSDCVRCHTATGHINYLTNMSITPFGGTSKTEGNEVLACNVCHVDYSYARRKVPQVTAFYNKSTVSKIRIRIAVTYPDVGESNLCLNCHVGRENGQVIKELANPVLTTNKVIAPTGAYDFSNAGLENSHYMTAGATIYKKSGFEFYSSNYYDNSSAYAHGQIGVSNFRGTGTSGPCVTCHMKPKNHTFSPVTKDQNGNTTGLASPVCNNASCHNGVMNAAVVEGQKEQFNAAMDALNAMLIEKLNVYFFNESPYMFTNAQPYNYFPVVDGSGCYNFPVKNWQNSGTSTFTSKYIAATPGTMTASPSPAVCSYASKVNNPGTPGTGPNNMGAAYNYNLLWHEFGAFAHNRLYVKRLIYDSISWLYDNNIRTTTNPFGYPSDVEAAIQNIQTSNLSQQKKDDACKYLFTDDPYFSYIGKDPRNWRPGSSPSSPVY